MQGADSAVQRVAAVDVLNLLAADGVHATFVREALDASEVWQAYRDRKHDLYLPAAKQQVTSSLLRSCTCTNILPASLGAFVGKIACALQQTA